MRDLAVLSSRIAYPDRGGKYVSISHGRGPYLFDVFGHRYLDAASGSGALILGHSDSRVAEVLSEQAAKLTVFPGRQMGVEIVETYASRLVEFAPEGTSRAIIYSSGSDAIEASIKLAVQYQRARGTPQKFKVVGRRGSYHGSTLAGLAAGGFLRRRKPYESILQEVPKASSAHCPRCEFGLEPNACAVECASSLERSVIAAGPETVAAVIVEPIVGAALSAAVPDERYFRLVREICDRHDVLLIADEVMTGFGRTGRRFAIEHWTVSADIIVAGKAISAGYFPLSALLVRSRVADTFEAIGQAFENGHTHACSPLASAVGLHVLERIKNESLVENAEMRGARLLASLKKELVSPWIANIRGRGLMIGFDLVDANESGSTSRVGLADLYQRLAMERGLIVYASSGSAHSEHGEHILLLPSLNIEDHHVDVIVEALVETLKDLHEL